MKRPRRIFSPSVNMARFDGKDYPSGWFYCDLYAANIDLLWNVAPEQVSAFIKRKYGIDEPFTMNSAKAVQIAKGGFPQGEVLAFREWRGRPQDHNILAHEAFHCADHILRSRGLTLNETSCEAYAYLIGWVVDQCLQIMTNRPR